MTDSTPRRPPPQGHVRAFDSVDDLFDEMDRAEKAAMENLPPQQASITYGAYVVRMVGDVLVWGTLHEKQDLLLDEYDDTEPHARGYRWGRFYSTLCPEGEEGSAHVSTLWSIRMEDFEKARLYGWSLGQASVEDIGWVVDFGTRMQQQMVASGLATEEGTVEPREHVYTQQAQQTHLCHLCGKEIRAGEMYERAVVVPAEVREGEINEFVRQHRSPVVKRHVGAPGGCP